MTVRRMEDEQMASPGGTIYNLKRSSVLGAKFGYEGVFEPHKGQGYHAKLRLDDSKGVKAQTTIPGPACKTPKEAALRLAKFRAAPFEIVKKDPGRGARGDGKRVTAKVCALLTRIVTRELMMIVCCLAAAEARSRARGERR